ncbi:MAG: HD-GYP domain-containing protein, partial [Clostridium sp.]
ELQYDYNEETIILKSGDCFYQKNIEKCFTMYTKHGCKIIKFSNAGDFNLVEEYNNNLYKALDEIQEKDKYTKDHCMRVGVYAQKLANAIKQPTHSMRELMIAAIAHDVGKCRISDEILLKPGRFNDEERKIMMEHPIHSYELLKNDFGMNETIAMIAACHHECYDGTGYPYGLKGEEIPIESRIIAIVDTYDAITTTRPYQEAKTPEKALDEMSKFSHKFDIKLFEVFKNLVLKKEIDINITPGV